MGLITRPIYSLTSIKRPPSIKRPLSKVSIYLSVICCTATSLLSGRGHLFAVASVLIIWVFTSIKRPANYLSMQIGEISWAKCFSHISCWCKKAWETCQRYLTIFLYIINSKKLTVHFNYVPSVCMGLKCTWCFVTMNFEFIFIYVHFLKAFCYKESIKSCLLPFLSNLYRTSIKRPLFKVPRVPA